MRGEHPSGVTRNSSSVGSSPHAWGTRMHRNKTLHDRRFIPTCVGNTRVLIRRATLRSVHPHMRGEHMRRVQEIPGEIGSSPHAWGTLRSNIKLLAKGRFIPTCVGNTPSPSKG